MNEADGAFLAKLGVIIYWDTGGELATITPETITQTSAAALFGIGLAFRHPEYAQALHYLMEAINGPLPADAFDHLLAMAPIE